MTKKDSKTNSFGGPRTPIWVWVIIFIIFLQIAKLAHRNDWFIEKKNTPKKYEKPEWFDELVNKKLTEKQIKDMKNRIYGYDQAVKEGRRDQ